MLALAGCARDYRFPEPADAPRSQLVVRLQLPQARGALLPPEKGHLDLYHDGGPCTANERGVSTTGRSYDGRVSLTREQPSVTLEVAARQRLRLAVSFELCLESFSYQPRPGRSYELTLIVRGDAFGQPVRCEAHLVDVGRGSLVPVQEFDSCGPRAWPGQGAPDVDVPL